MIVYLRNAHPKQTVYLPIRPGWCRVLRPAVTAAVPTVLLHTPAVRQLLLRRLVAVVDGTAWDADTRQRRASRTDWARAIAAAEQREFDKLRQGVAINPRRKGSGVDGKGRYSRWTAERKARLEQLWRAGASVDIIAGEVGLGRANVWAVVQRFGLPSRREATRGKPGPRQPRPQPQPEPPPPIDWTAERTALLHTLWEQGWSTATIGGKLGVSSDTVRNRLELVNNRS